MTTNNDIIGNDELSRPVTHTMVSETDGALAKLRLMSSIEGPLQFHLLSMLPSFEHTANRLADKTSRLSSMTDGIMGAIRDDVSAMVDREFDRRSDYFPSEDRVLELVEESIDGRKFQRRLDSAITEAIDNYDFDGIKSDIQSEIERDLDSTISNAIDDHDFGDIFDEQAKTIVSTLVSDIKSDPNHPLVNAIVNAIADRLTK